MFATRDTPYFRPSGLVSDTSFVRFVDVPFATAATALTRWWEDRQHDGVVTIGSYVLVGAVARDPGIARVRFAAHHRLNPVRHPLPMEIELASWSRLRPMTRLELVARRRVHLGQRRYLVLGHQVLETITRELKRSAPPPPLGQTSTSSP
jgi:hypothetical protein